MIRDFKFLRRNPAKNGNAEEVENVPPNSRDSANPQISTEPSRPPLNAIMEPPSIPKIIPDQEFTRPTKVDRTPTKPKPKPKHSDSSVPLRTPEKQGLMSRNRFNWAQKSDNQSNNGAGELKEEGRAASNGNTPNSRAVGRATLSYSECNSLQSTPCKSVSKPPNPGYSMPSGSRTVCNMSARMAGCAALSKGIPSSCNNPTVVNTVEVPYFELKEDPSFWMEHNVQVLIRVRPLNSMEKSSFGYSRCLKQDSAQTITWVGQPETRFMFDHVACEGVDQEMLFRMVGLPMVENCLSGYNSCMFAYGQTGSGKTYTMLGDIDDLEVNPSPNRGMTPRIFEFLFARIRAEEESRRDEQLKYNCKCSFLEIYNEQITDLLDPSSTNLMLREDMKKGVYVDNLSEYEVHNVGDILQLLTQGSANRKVAATNMNRESSRSHSVFTCVIESKWEKDSTTNFRFARLNLVDLAGSERQKTSGAEGERLKEAANINKSLSSLGNVIMVLVDIAHGKPRHVPYRDSRLTFLLQDSLGGNSKTMIIANVSPSICSGPETLNTLKFAQRAKLIQNNAIINEDSSGDVAVLKHQIKLLKEELSALKRERVNRSLMFSPGIDLETRNEENNDANGGAIEGVTRISCKQLKSLESTLAGSLRREKMAESAVTQLEAEIELLNRLVSQREEETRCAKMMLKFREDKIQRMESLKGGLMSADDYLREENKALSEEIQLLRSGHHKNPEVTRFAAENIKLLHQVERFQDFYGEGERQMLMDEVTELRNQLMFFVKGNSKNSNHLEAKVSNHSSENNLSHELQRTLTELEESKIKLSSFLEENAKLKRELEELNASSNNDNTYGQEQDCSTEVIKESIVEVPFSIEETTMTTQRKKEGTSCSNLRKSVEDIMDLQLELDILKIILEEERTYHSEQEEIAKSLNKELQLSKEMTKSLSDELKTVKLVVEALESEQIRSINEIEDLRSTNVRFEEMLKKKELEISYLKDRASFKDLSSCKPLENDGSPLTVKLKKMHHSLEKAKRLNELYQNDLASEESHQEEMEEIRRQVEGETAEVIVCLQEELSALQNEVHESRMKELESNDKFAQLQKEMKIMLEEKENQLKTMKGEWDLIASEIEGILSDGNAALEQASDETDIISSSFNQKRILISEQFGRLKQCIFEKEFMISELNQCMKDAVDRKDDVERMLMSLRGAALIMTENHQQECSEKDREILSLTSTVAELHNLINHVEDQLRATSSCATAAFVIVNRLSELNSHYYSDLQDKELQIREFKEMITKKDTDFQKELEASKECCAKLSHELSEERRCREALVVNLEKNEENKISEQVQDLCNGVSSLKLSMNKYEKESDKASNMSNCVSANDGWAGSKSLKYSTAAAAAERETAIDLLKKEIECAVKCLQELKAQMDRMQFEKDEILASEKCSRKRIESVMNQTVVLGDAMDSFEGVFELKASAIDGKLRRMEETLQKSLDSWLQERELMEDEIDEARVVAAQKTIEASCILKKFEEVQDTVKEADIMINELMIANEALKLNARDSKAKEKDFNSERVNIMQEIQSLKLSNNLKEQNYETDFAIMKKMISELESAISEVQTASAQEWKSIALDFLAMKSQIHESAESVRKLLEGVWSEIIAKDCAVSVLHLCHMGILLETSNGLNAENGFLQNGLSESNTVISELREHNLRSRRELETCRALKGKLLTDIKKGFDRVLSKVDETGEVTLKLSSFQEKINDLQFQEEIMLQRSNDIGSELAMLMKELDLSNKQALASILDQERLLKEKDELLQYQEENFVLESLAKEFESLTLSSELKQICLLKADIENAFVITLENLKKEVVFNSLDAALILHDKEFKLEKLVEEFEVKESAIEASSSYITELRQQLQNLQNDIRLLETDSHRLQIVLEQKDEELGRLSSVEREKESLQLHLNSYKAESEASARNSHNVVVENQRLRDNVSSLENCIAKLEEDLSRARDEIINQELSQSAVQEELCFRIKDLEVQLGDVEALKKEKISLRINESECLKATNLRSLKSIHLAETVDKLSCNLLNVIEERFVKVDDMFHKMDNEIERGCEFLDQFEEMENLAMQLDSEVLFLQTQLLRKDDILEGLLFDMSLLQESASNSQDSKHEKDELIASLSALEKESELRSRELEQAADERRKLEAQLAEKAAEISALESDLIRENERINSLSKENSELLAASHDAFDARDCMNKELLEARVKIENLEMEVAELEIALAKLDETNDSLKIKLDTFDELEGKVVTLTKELELARAVAEENEGIALEAQEIAEMQKVHAEEKEAEVKLLERSIEELECTINVLEQKVDIVKGEAERQRLQREELELELLSVKEQMHKVRSNDSDVKRCLDEKEKSLQESLQRVQLLEKEIATRDAEISQCKLHISELNLHAEAQASEYKQKFKALEAMLEQVKSEVPSSSTSSSNKIERNSSKPRGSGSPFKCIGLGLAQQIKSERDEELTAGRQRIEELEALAASRQKEIFMLKARLASTESMTHDVIRDLLGVKLNMKNYANLIDNQQLQSLMKEVEHHNVKSEVKEQEVVSLKQQINEFLKERKGWLEEIERKQAELMSALVALEKLRQQDQLLATENEMLKTDNMNQKKRVRELELEIKKLSGQQNIQQRIHHHAKIKEENNSLRCQNEELSNKLHKSETILSRVKEELAQFRAANGRSPYINFDEEQLLHKKLKENEEEKLQLAQKLLGLCTSVLKAAGITRPTSEISVSVAEEALEQMKNSVVSLEMELGDAKLKNRISDERIRLSELVPQTSATEALRVGEDGVERKRTTQTSFLSAFDR